MISYELAKQLKDNGFPINIKSSGRYFVLKNGTVLDNHLAPSVCVNDIVEQVIKPTLSELIEACGEDFRLLSKRATWRAESIMGVEDFGNTPEEAVANLWLALNKKTIV